MQLTSLHRAEKTEKIHVRQEKGIEIFFLDDAHTKQFCEQKFEKEKCM